MKLKLITEEDLVDFKSYDDLSYDDMDGAPNVLLLNKGTIIGETKVWLDSEMEGREYITLNHEIVYLDTLKKIGK